MLAGALAAAGILAGAPAAGAERLVASWSFDTPVLSGSFRDSTGDGHMLVQLTRSDGGITSVVRDKGRAVQFPRRCLRRGACPQAILESPHDETLNPGAAPLRWGATVLLSANQTSAGQNLVQKGYANQRGEYKLQVDGRAGRPSCVLVGTGGDRIHRAQSPVTVADGQWHALECRRAASTLVLLVDHVVRARATVPARLSVRNTAPVRIGGKHLGGRNDQFHGALDDVWIRVG